MKIVIFWKNLCQNDNKLLRKLEYSRIFLYFAKSSDFMIDDFYVSKELKKKYIEIIECNEDKIN